MSTEGKRPGGRFKPGQSGNPKGRPRREPIAALSLDDQPTKAQFLKEALRKVPIRDGGKRATITAREAVVRSQMTSAMKGNAYAQRHVIEQMQRLDRERALEIAEDNEFWTLFCTVKRKEIERARSAGETPPAIYPHPDDIVIRRGRPVIFTGPVDEEDAVRFDTYCGLRDVLLMQNALDWKLFDAGRSGDEADEPGGALLLALALNGVLPARLRLSDAEFVTRILRYEATNRRTLLKSVYQAWRGLGVGIRRGHVFPPRRVVIAQLQWSKDFLAKLDSGELDMEELARGTFMGAHG